MNFRAKYFLLLAIILTAGRLYSQIGGLSGSKLVAHTVDVVDDKKIEVEPAFSYISSSKYWDTNSRLQELFSTSDSVRKITSMAFRFTYGMFNKMEVGISFSAGLDMGSLGARYIVLQKRKIGTALIAGLNLPFGNRTFDKRVRLAESATSLGVGGVTTMDFTRNLSLDVDAQYIFILTPTPDNDKGKFLISADMGYYIFNHTLQLIGSAAFSSVNNSDGNHMVATMDAGITVETGKNFIIVLGFPFDVYGRNEAKNSGFTFALTITVD